MLISSILPGTIGSSNDIYMDNYLQHKDTDQIL